MNTKQAKTETAQGAQTVKTDASVVVMAKKPVLNLEETTKVISNLWKLQKQRGRLMMTIDELKAFTTKIEEDENLKRSEYSQCKLVIKDDLAHEFTTRTPVLIGDVIQYILKRCAERLAEVESEIVLPN